MKAPQRAGLSGERKAWMGRVTTLVWVSPTPNFVSLLASYGNLSLPTFSERGRSTSYGVSCLLTHRTTPRVAEDPQARNEIRHNRQVAPLGLLRHPFQTCRNTISMNPTLDFRKRASAPLIVSRRSIRTALSARKRRGSAQKWLVCGGGRQSFRSPHAIGCDDGQLHCSRCANSSVFDGSRPVTSFLGSPDLLQNGCMNLGGVLC
jgi:hypothetical protein